MPPQLTNPLDPLLPTTSTTTSTSTSTTTTSTQDTATRTTATSATSAVTPNSSSSSRPSSTSSSTSSNASQTTTPTTGITSPTTTTPGNVVTSTSTMFVTSASRNVVSPSTTVGSGGSTPFLQNTGAVAGVFTVVGLIGLSLIFVLARNFHRRRQQEAFDRELQEATRQAAATSAGPFFDDDDDDPYKNSYNAPGASIYTSPERQFSDMSHGTHGTYGQPPLSVESYGMREINQPPGPGEMLYSSDPYAAGAAGIGVARARSMRVEGSNNPQPDYSAALKDGNSPYPAFAAPNPGHMPRGIADPYGNTSMGAQNMELLSAAGLGAHIGGADALAMRNQSYAQQQYGGMYSQGSLDRKRSVDGGVQQYHAGGYGASPAGPSVPTNRYSVVNEDVEDPYGGVADGGVYPSDTPGPLPNPFERDISEEGYVKDADAESVHSRHSQGEPKRVLKVANE